MLEPDGGNGALARDWMLIREVRGRCRVGGEVPATSRIHQQAESDSWRRGHGEILNGARDSDVGRGTGSRMQKSVDFVLKK